MLSDQTRVASLRSQLGANVLAFGPDTPRLSWQIESSGLEQVQQAYELEASANPAFDPLLASTGVVTSGQQVGVEVPGAPLASREVRFFRVRILTEAGWTGWSPALRLEAGLLDPRDWTASAITMAGDPGAARQSPSPMLRTTFEVPSRVATARLYVTSLGLHRVSINGMRVTNDLLAPGWTSYGKRLLSETYDVTELLSPGQNAIGAILADGWYRGRLGWEPEHDRCRYGAELALLAQLEMRLEDGSAVRIQTGPDWKASTGEILVADLYDGCTIDLRLQKKGFDRPGFDDADWLPAAVVPLDLGVVEPRLAPAVRPIEVRTVEPTRRGETVTRLDTGQNLAGFVRLRVRGRAGDTVTVRHAEVLEPDGSLHTRSLRSAKATDTYTLDTSDETELAPAFTFHGFRYADIETTADVLAAEIVAISSDTPSRSSFSCSDPRLNRLHQNVAWSQRGNFVSIPTDCPQRDERLGWTGDAQAFAATASTLFDSQSFWMSWLRDLDLDQDDDLGVSTVVPDVVVGGEARFGRAGWADAATIVPWAVYESYGDVEVIRRQYPSMRRWVDSLVGRQGADGLLPASFQFGDWLDPDAPSDRPWEAKADSTFIANAFFARSARLAADAAALLGDVEGASRYGRLSDQVGASTWERWASHLVLNQTGCAIALKFAITPDSRRLEVADALAALVRDADGRVATGFLGTPLVLSALSEEGRFDEAYLMLLRDTAPSWLYQVAQGATTVWERWDAIRPDGSIHPGKMAPPPGLAEAQRTEGQMLSFNHYAYGAVVDWVYRNVAGLAPDRSEPGYRHVRFAPQPSSAISWAKASVKSAYGEVSIDWRIDAAGSLVCHLAVPFGTSAEFHPPMTDQSRIAVDGVSVASDVLLRPGSHTVLVTAPRIAQAG